MIALIEQACGRKAEKQLLPMQPGDVRDTYADISAIQRDLGFQPTTAIDEGVPALRRLVPALSRRLGRRLRDHSVQRSTLRPRSASVEILEVGEQAALGDQAGRSRRPSASRIFVRAAPRRGRGHSAARARRRRARAPYSCRASSGSASGSWTVTSWPSRRAGGSTSIDLAVAQVGHILLEGEPEHQRRSRLAAARLWSWSATQAPMPSLIERPARITSGSWPSCWARWLR